MNTRDQERYREAAQAFRTLLPTADDKLIAQLAALKLLEDELRAINDLAPRNYGAEK